MSLLPHPGSPAPAGLALTIEVGGEDARDALRIRYELTGPVAALRLPERTCAAQRRDGLWHHTCFEAFLKPDETDVYLEFNFAPSGHWAAYRFGSRRAGMRPLPEMATPEIAVARAADRLEVAVRIPLAGFTDVPIAGGGARLGLAAVLEDATGRRSYWALAHAGAQPDFHDPRTFTLTLPARGAAQERSS